MEYLLEYLDDMDDVIEYFTQAMIEGRIEVIHYESIDGDTRVTQIVNFRVVTDVNVTTCARRWRTTLRCSPLRWRTPAQITPSISRPKGCDPRLRDLISERTPD